MSISHLLLADDTLIFCGADVNQVHNLRCLLLCFKAISSLGRSEVIPIGRVGEVQVLADILRCRVSSPPMTYLGFSLGVKFKSVRIWDEIVERVGRRLACWKFIYLSKGGRITLIKSTLSSLLTYFFISFFKPEGRG